jgi:CDP-glycerol glycerophosphotransferase (TagB/SpsB family)
LVEPLAQLSDDYQIVIKGHHNDEMSGLQWMTKAEAFGHKHLFSGGYDQVKLLEAADAVISDFSGAAFDAVYARIPVVLYQGRAEEKVGTQKFDLSSLEYRERDRIGRVCNNADDLGCALKEIVLAPNKFLDSVADLRDNLFVDVSSPDSVALAKSSVEKLLAGGFPARSKPQAYVRETIQRLLQIERELKLQRAKSGLQLSKAILSWSWDFSARLLSRIKM